MFIFRGVLLSGGQRQRICLARSDTTIHYNITMYIPIHQYNTTLIIHPFITNLTMLTDRCLYSTAPIVILDSPFSALDNKIVHNILGKVSRSDWHQGCPMQCLEKAITNILLKKRRTVILTTSDPSLLSLAQVEKLNISV